VVATIAEKGKGLHHFRKASRSMLMLTAFVVATIAEKGKGLHQITRV
jgi:hypothetical protein